MGWGRLCARQTGLRAQGLWCGAAGSPALPPRSVTPSRGAEGRWCPASSALSPGPAAPACPAPRGLGSQDRARLLLRVPRDGPRGDITCPTCAAAPTPGVSQPGPPCSTNAACVAFAPSLRSPLGPPLIAGNPPHCWDPPSLLGTPLIAAGPPPTAGIPPHRWDPAHTLAVRRLCPPCSLQPAPLRALQREGGNLWQREGGNRAAAGSYEQCRGGLQLRL